MSSSYMMGVYLKISPDFFHPWKRQSEWYWLTFYQLNRNGSNELVRIQADIEPTQGHLIPLVHCIWTLVNINVSTSYKICNALDIIGSKKECGGVSIWAKADAAEVDNIMHGRMKIYNPPPTFTSYIAPFPPYVPSKLQDNSVTERNGALCLRANMHMSSESTKAVLNISQILELTSQFRCDFMARHPLPKLNRTYVQMKGKEDRGIMIFEWQN